MFHFKWIQSILASTRFDCLSYLKPVELFFHGEFEATAAVPEATTSPKTVL